MMLRHFFILNSKNQVIINEIFSYRKSSEPFSIKDLIHKLKL
jgi:hypothetical protein